MKARPDDDGIDNLRRLRREYEAALLTETNPQERWRLRQMLRSIQTYLEKLEDESGHTICD